MKYHHLIEKLIEQQDSIMSEIDKLRNEGKLPEELEKAAAPMQGWAEAADKDLGDGEIPQGIPNPDPLAMFSNMLSKYEGIFDASMREHIAQYREYAASVIDMARTPKD